MSDRPYDVRAAEWELRAALGEEIRPGGPGWLLQAGLLLTAWAGAGLLTVVFYYVLMGLLMAGKSPLSSCDYNMELHTVDARLAAVLHLVAGTLLFLVIYHGLRDVPVAKLRGWFWQHRRIGFTAAVLVGLANAIWFAGVLGGAASSEDDLTYFFQARLFAHGQVMLPTASLEPLTRAFKWWWTVMGSQGICSYQVPGHSLLLALGLWLGHFSIVPVLQAAITCLATYRAALLLFGRRTAVLAALLFVTSPYAITVFASYSASTSAACMVSLALWAWAALLGRETAWRAFVLGVCIGLICWMRPAAAVCVSLPMAAWWLIRLARGAGSWRATLAGLAGALPLVALYIGYCSHVSGRFSVTPGDVYWLRLTSGELSAEHLTEPPPRQAVGLPNVLIGLARLNVYLHGWPISLLPIAALLFLPGKGPKTWLLIIPMLGLLGFYACFRNVTGWYYFEVGPIMYVLSARGILLARLWTRRRGWSNLSRAWPRLVCAGVVLSCFQSIPLSLARQYTYGRAFNIVHDQVATRLAGQQAAVLMDKDAWDRWGPYLTGRNSPFLDDSVIYLNASLVHWSRQEIETVAGPRQVYYLHIVDGALVPLKLDRVPLQLLTHALNRE